MKKKTTILLISGVAIGTSALIATPIAICLSYFRPTIQLELESLTKIEETIKMTIDNQFTKYGESILPNDFFLNLGYIIYENNYFEASKNFNEKLINEIKEKNENNENNKNIFTSISLSGGATPIEGKPFKLTYTLGLSKNYLYSDKKLENKYTILDNKINFTIETNIKCSSTNSGSEVKNEK